MLPSRYSATQGERKNRRNAGQTRRHIVGRAAGNAESIGAGARVADCTAYSILIDGRDAKGILPSAQTKSVRGVTRLYSDRCRATAAGGWRRWRRRPHANKAAPATTDTAAGSGTGDT